MPSYTHNDVTRSPVISVSLHGKQQTLSATGGDIANSILIPVEQTGTHPDNLILNDPERVEQEGIESIGVHIFDKAGLTGIRVFFGLLIDVGKGLARCRADVGIDSFV